MYIECCPKKCQEETLIIEGVRYAIVHTPAFFDSRTPTEEVLMEIVEFILRYASRIKAILIVFGI